VGHAMCAKWLVVSVRGQRGSVRLWVLLLCSWARDAIRYLCCLLMAMPARRLQQDAKPLWCLVCCSRPRSWSGKVEVFGVIMRLVCDTSSCHAMCVT
jgi:hypothetical protein